MARVLLLLLIALAIYLLFRGFFRSQTRDDPAKPKEGTVKGPEDMVACARCGVNLPVSETQVEQGRRVCANNPRCLP